MTVAELEVRMSAAELMEWQAYFGLEAEDMESPTEEHSG